MGARRVSLLTALGGVLLAVPVFGHHSFSQFDQTKKVTYTGDIVEVQFTNPHTWVWIEVKDEKGQVVKWGFEGGSVRQMYNAGYTRDALVNGLKNVVVEANPAKDGSPHASLLGMTLPDGRKFGRGFGPGA